MATTGIRIWVYGHVQGVGFRYSTQSVARQHNLAGYAKNLDDGSVEVLACGEEAGVEALLIWLKAGGPRSARVEKVVTEPCQPSSAVQKFTIG